MTVEPPDEPPEPSERGRKGGKGGKGKGSRLKWISAGEAGKREGMGRAEQHADPRWWARMLECGKTIAKRNELYDSDMVEDLCAELYPSAGTHEQRAVGPLMRKLAQLGHGFRTEFTRKSTQARCHRREIRIWQSLIYEGPAAPHDTEEPPEGRKSNGGPSW